ncbi:MAG: AI-2E family transporter [Pseudomonadales bacterium]
MSNAQRGMAFGFVAMFIIIVYLLKPILAPFLIGILCAYLGDPLADRLEAMGLGRTAAVSVVFVVMTSLLVLVVILLVPLLGRQLDALVSRLPHTLEWAQTVALPWLSTRFNIPQYELPLEEAKNLIATHWQEAGSIAKVVMQSLTSSSLAFLGWIANLLLIPVVAFYLLRDWDLMMERIRDALPRRMEPTVVSLAGECDSVLSAFLRGQLFIMFLLGIIYTLGLMLVGIDLALLLGMLAGLASVVPYMGFIVGICAASIAAMVQFGDWFHLLGVAAVFGIGQALEGTILTPLLVGDRIGLHPVAVIFAVLAGGQLAGFVGVLLALPVAAIIMVLLRHMHGEYKSSAIYQSGKDNAHTG